MKKNYLTLVVIPFLVITIAYANITPDEYLNEFKNQDESCEIIDFFVYDVSCPSFFNPTRLCTKVPVFYKCCNDNKCATIIFDVQKRGVLTEIQNQELIDLNYIKYNLYNENLSIIHFDPTGFDVCSYFGKDELRQESVNLAASASERLSPLLGTEQSKKVKDTIDTAKKMGKVSKFTPSTFLLSVSCSYDNHNLKEAIESFANTNIYMKNIQNNYAQEGYVFHLTKTVKEGKLKLKNYADSVTAQIRDSANKFTNRIIATLRSFLRFFINFDLNGSDKLEIEKTKLDEVKEAYEEILNYEPYLINPNNQEILVSHKSRVSDKISQYDNAYSLFTSKYNQIVELKPAPLKIFFSDIFMRPNYNISDANFYLDQAKDSKEIAEDMFKAYKFNTAIAELSLPLENLNISEQIYLREQKINRSFDIKSIIILVIIAYILYSLFFKSQTYYPN
ncbi:MAG: hypothetical protein AABW46_01395 [Nanoarchaeota archaeon]